MKPANESDVFEQQRQNNSLEPKRTGDEEYLIFKIISVKLQNDHLGGGFEIFIMCWLADIYGVPASCSGFPQCQIYNNNACT